MPASERRRSGHAAVVAARSRAPYTTDEDAAILTVCGDAVATLAQRLGHTRAAINSRRYELRRAGASPRRSLADLAPVLRHRQPTLGPNFARSEWFSEDLARIATARR